MFGDVSDDQAEGVLPNSQTRGVTSFFVVFALLGLVLAVFNVHRGGLVIVGVAECALMVVFAVRTSKSSVRWNRQGVVGRWTGATRQLVWSEISAFEHREPGSLGVRLRDGRWVRLMPYPRSRLNKPEQAIATLEAARQAAE